MLATLWPSFPHFARFGNDERLAGVRLNSAMIDEAELKDQLTRIKFRTTRLPLYYDVKGRQLRVTEVLPNPDYLDIRINHPVEVDSQVVVLLKGGADAALLGEVSEGGLRLTMQANPRFGMKVGESLYFRHPSFRIKPCAQFTELELKKIALVKKAGFTRYFLSYVQCQRDVDEFRELVGRDSQIFLKIEDNKGLAYVANEFKKEDNLTLVAARGDLYVEVNQPHDILAAQRLIIEKDPKACAGSRLLLSLVREEVPSCADLSELAWLYDIGYRSMMLCDELCLKGELLGKAVTAFDAFRTVYSK